MHSRSHSFCSSRQRTTIYPKRPFPAQKDTTEKCSKIRRYTQNREPTPRLWCCSVGGPCVCVEHQGAIPLGTVFIMFIDMMWSRCSEVLTLYTESLPKVVETLGRRAATSLLFHIRMAAYSWVTLLRSVAAPGLDLADVPRALCASNTANPVFPYIEAFSDQSAYIG